MALITSTVGDIDEEKLQQTWNFYSYTDIKFDSASVNPLTFLISFLSISVLLQLHKKLHPLS